MRSFLAQQLQRQLHSTEHGQTHHQCILCFKAHATVRDSILLSPTAWVYFWKVEYCSN